MIPLLATCDHQDSSPAVKLVFADRIGCALTGSRMSGFDVFVRKE
jgi:hypothetical protein